MPIRRIEDVFFTNPSEWTEFAARMVIKASQNLSQDAVFTAVVRCTGKKNGNKAWHRGGTNPNTPLHLTTDFKDSKGRHITTMHVDFPTSEYSQDWNNPATIAVEGIPQPYTSAFEHSQGWNKASTMPMENTSEQYMSAFEYFQTCKNPYH